MKTLLIACGNTLRGDDGVGWRIAAAVARQFHSPDLTVLFTHQLLPEHAQAISTCETVLFVDCSAANEPGTLSLIPIEPADQLPSILTHHFDPAALLRLCVDLYAHRPARSVAITVGGESFGISDQLSRSVKAAIPKAIQTIQQTLTASAPF